MEAAPLPEGQLTGSALFYTAPEPLTPQAHSKLAVVRSDTPFGFAAEAHAVPLTVSEFAPAGLSYPIIFAGDDRIPLAVVGVTAGRNLFVKADGSYQLGAYLPAYMRRYPFVLATDEASDRLIVCIERGSPLFSEAGDTPLFTAQGEPSDYTQAAIKFCDDFQTDMQRTLAFVDLLKSLDLFEQRQTVYTPQNPDGSTGEPQLVAEYFAVTDERLKTLSAEKLAELRDNGALQQIYAHITSLSGWDRLMAMNNQQELEQARPAAANLQ